MARSSFVRRTLAARPIGERDVIYIHIGRELRPAICLREMPGHGDLLVCAVSTQLRQCVEGFDEIVDPNKTPGLGLTRKSVIRLGCLGRVESHESPGRIGHISVPQHRRLLKKLSDYLII